MMACDNGQEKELNSLTGNVVSKVLESSIALSPSMSLEEVQASGAVVISADNKTHFAIGYQQVSSNNQNPILMRFDNGELTYARNDYEKSGDDGTGRGLLLNPSENTLYAVFTATGTQGDAGQDYRRFTANGWQKSYGKGGGARVVVLAKINPDNGEAVAGTFVTAELSNGNANSVAGTDLHLLTDNKIELTAKSWFSPRNVDKSRMNCSGDSPFEYKITFDADLEEAVSASAVNCQ